MPAYGICSLEPGLSGQVINMDIFRFSSTVETCTRGQTQAMIWADPTRNQERERLYEYSFAVKGPMLWNRLPKHVKGALTLSAFKGSLGDFLNQIPDMPPSTGYSAIQECTITLFWIAPSKTNESVFLVQSCSYRIGLLQWSY